MLKTGFRSLQIDILRLFLSSRQDSQIPLVCRILNMKFHPRENNVYTRMNQVSGWLIYWTFPYRIKVHSHTLSKNLFPSHRISAFRSICKLSHLGGQCKNPREQNKEAKVQLSYRKLDSNSFLSTRFSQLVLETSWKCVIWAQLLTCPLFTRKIGTTLKSITPWILLILGALKVLRWNKCFKTFESFCCTIFYCLQI